MKSGLTLSAFWMAKKRSKNTYINQLISARGSMMYHPPSIKS